MLRLTNVPLFLTSETRLKSPEIAPNNRQMRNRSVSMLKKVYMHKRYVRIINKMKRAGLQNLRRYFELIIFQSYLQSTEPDTMASFESVETYVKNRPGLHLSRFSLCVTLSFNRS